MISERVDTCIVIDHFNGHRPASVAIARCAKPGISILTYAEALVGSPADKKQLHRDFLHLTFEIFNVTLPIAEAALPLRTKRLKLIDGIILATANHYGVPLITRDKDFGQAPTVQRPYTLPVAP